MRILNIFLMIVGVFFLGTFLLKDIVLENVILNEVKKKCGSCEFSFNFKSSFFGGKVVLSDVNLVQGIPEYLEFQITIPEITVIGDGNLFYSALKDKKLEIGQIEILSPKVVLTEGDVVNPSKKNNHPENVLLNVKKIIIENGEFQYRRITGKDYATVSLKEIYVETKSPFGLGGHWNKTEFEWVATALLESQGKVQLNVVTNFFNPDSRAKIKLMIHQFKLEKSNPYFLVREKMSLSGELIKGYSDRI